jgi:hypothetical protein
MAICNRGLDPSEQRHAVLESFGAVPTAATIMICAIPYNSELKAVKVAVSGLSGSPTYDLRIQRFIPGAGATVLNPGSTTLTGTAFGTSGIQSFLLQGAGGSLVQLLANDVLTITSATANTAVTNMAVGVVIQALQDIKTLFGV